MAILTTADVHAPAPVAHSDPGRPSTWYPARCHNDPRHPFTLPANPKPVGDVAARINHGRWLIDCPAGCNSAEMVHPDDPAVICTHCGSGGWWHVRFPPTSKRALIEAALDARWVAEHRNWTPGEDVDDLLAENHAHKGEVRT